MADINKTMKSISTIRGKIVKDLIKMVGMYEEVSSDVQKRFNDEFKTTGSMNGLEDFYMLNQILKKNAISTKNSLTLLNKMRDISGFNVTEEEVDEEALEEIFEEEKIK